ncbi:hypothetical protein QBC42DRAFT_263138 [Cladorrhinum samala]|uniref:Uncharacterized protein n=1 Tax=Cladorrhinum samala TaxID=585594 RepID=A0AAV9HV02_9PEZI|nr:hypothetical protein QBC42DRAFT_263138 [Cladorrhinum samala]
MFRRYVALVLVLQAICLCITTAARQTTSTVFSGSIQTPQTTATAESTDWTATATGTETVTTTMEPVIEVEVSLPTVLPEKKDLPVPFNTPRKKTIEYRYLAIIALPAVLSLLFLAYSQWRKSRPTFSDCRCWHCRLAIVHFCRPVHIHCCAECPKCRAYEEAQRVQPAEGLGMSQPALSGSPIIGRLRNSVGGSGDDTAMMVRRD